VTSVGNSETRRGGAECARAQGTRLSLPCGIVLLAAAVTCVPWPQTLHAQDARPAARSDTALQRWVATAPGRIESRSEEVRLSASIAGRIAEVRVKPNDKVFAGELLVRLDDDEALARLASAEANVALRVRARNDDKAKGSPQRRKAEDDVADAERDVAQAWARLDNISASKGTLRSSVEDAAVGGARSALTRAQEQLRQKQDALRSAREEAALPIWSEGDLNVARADLTLAEAVLQKTRIRAPIASTVLQIRAKVGEMAVPSPEQWLVLLGDVSALRVRAELDEHDFAKVRVGQRVVVRAYAFPDREFGPLAVGMQVDAYFSADGSEQQGMR
jgi:HlyD family secretion protein